MVALIYFPSHNMTSIIDWIVLNFCIRNGNRCFHSPHQYHRLYKPTFLPYTDSFSFFNVYFPNTSQ